MMGVGKTTIGTAVAARLGRRFVDSDELIEARTGRTVREIFESDGEPAFRQLETERSSKRWPTRTRSSSPPPAGCVLRPENRTALERSGAFVVWLTADPAVLAGRVHVRRSPTAARRRPGGGVAPAAARNGAAGTRRSPTPSSRPTASPREVVDDPRTSSAEADRG